MRKLSGLISRYIRFFSCIVCTRESWEAISSDTGSQILNTYHLLRNHHNGLCRESSVTMIKKVFERWSEKINDEDVVEALLAEIIDIRDTRYSPSVVAWIEANCRLTASDEDFVCPVLIP